MHYPVMTEKHLADCWQVSLKTLRRWRVPGMHPLEMVARDGIEPSTRGFSVARRARFGASKSKKRHEFSRRRPNRPVQPSLFRTLGAEPDRAAA